MLNYYCNMYLKIFEINFDRTTGLKITFSSNGQFARYVVREMGTDDRLLLFMFVVGYMK